MPVPTASPAEPTQPTERIEPVEIPPRKRRRWIGVLIALVVLIVLLVIGFFVADNYARQYANDYVRERIITVLGLPDGADIDVDLGTGSILLQAARGSIDEVTVGIPQLAFGDVDAAATLTATTVPLDGAQPIDTLDIEVTVSEANVQKLSGYLSGIDLSSIELRDELIRISTELNLLFVTVPVSVDLEPTAVPSGISFTPVTVLLGDDQISVADLRGNPLVGGLAGTLLASREFCVANYLPQALTVDDVSVVGNDLVISIDGDGTALSGPELSTMGSCPA